MDIDIFKEFGNFNSKINSMMNKKMQDFDSLKFDHEPFRDMHAR